jgi:RNA polymerase sigma-70 factor, ECF subfamily
MERADRSASPTRRGWRSDEELLVAIAAGDEAAFGELFDRVGGTLFGVVERVVGDRRLAEEVTQEVFVDVWRTAARFAPDRTSLATRIAVMGHRRAVDRVRSERESRSRTERVGVGDGLAPPDEVAERADLRTERTLVRDALGDLTELEREALRLAYDDGHTSHEVAELLDVSSGTIESGLRCGLRRLGDVMPAGRALEGDGAAG